MRNTIKSLVVLLAALTLSAGCAKEKVSVGSPGPTPITDVTPGVDDLRSPTAPNGGSVDADEASDERSADFFPASDAVFQDYAVNQPLNNPERHRLTMNVQKMWNDDIGGEVRLTYYDNGVKRVGIFQSGDREEDISKNKWFDFGADEVFTGYFSDNFGAIIVVVDDVVDFGDGGGDQILSGKVYFMNFEPTRAPKSPTKCWNIEYGPYACGAVFSGIVPGNITNHDYPGKQYRLLGTFKGLSRAKGFNTDFNP